MQKPGYNIQSGVVPSISDPNLSGVDVPGLSDRWNSMSYSDFRRSNSDQFTGRVDIKVNEHWDVQLAGTYLEYAVDALFSGNLGMANNSTLLQGRRVKRTIYTNRDETGELKAVGQYLFGDTSLRLLLGTQLSRRRFDNASGQAPNDPALGASPTASPLPLWNLGDASTWDRDARVPLSALTANRVDQITRFLDQSAYAGVTLGFFEKRLLALAGWRLTATSSQLSDLITGSSQSKLQDRAGTPQLGLLYKLSRTVSTFASYSRSFVPGSQIISNVDGSFSPARPTEGRGYDIGLKLALPEPGISGTLSFFDISNKNIINDISYLDTVTGVQRFHNVQSGEQRSYGVELDSTMNLTPSWQLYLSYSYNHARIREVSGNDSQLLAGLQGPLSTADQANLKNILRYHGAPLQMSAPHMCNLWSRHDFISGPLQGAFLCAGINCVWDQALLPDTPAWARQSYVLYNAQVGYAWRVHGRSCSVELTGKNLTDELYRPSQSTRCRPREFILSVSTRF